MVRTSRESWRLRASVVAVAFLGAFGVPQAAAETVAAGESSQSPAEILDYWTQERMDSALPASVLLEDVPAISGVAPDEVGRERTVPSAGPSNRQGLLDGILGGGGGGRKAEEIENPRPAPFRTHGKVFFTLGGVGYVCSGTVVNSKSKSLVTTAGHCVYGESEGFASKWMFVPAFDDSSDASPYGRWAMKDLNATRQWKAREDIRYDVGMATMAKRNGKKLQRVVGARGITFNRAGNQNFSAFGYPQGAPYDGDQLYRCNSRQQGTDRSQRDPEPGRIKCDMTGGSSGGGWIVGNGLVNSVVSYGYECVVPLPPLPPLCENPEEGNLFGPYFGESVRKLYRSEKR